MRQYVQFVSSSDISLEVVNVTGVLPMHAIVECISFYFRVFIASTAFSSIVRVVTVNVALVLLIRLVQEL